MRINYIVSFILCCTLFRRSISMKGRSNFHAFIDHDLYPIYTPFTISQTNFWKIVSVAASEYSMQKFDLGHPRKVPRLCTTTTTVHIINRTPVNTRRWFYVVTTSKQRRRVLIGTTILLKGFFLETQRWENGN